MALKATILPVTPFQQNCTLLWCDETMAGALVDAGGDVDRLLQAVEKTGVRLEKLLVTHGHLDHAGGVAEIQERLGLPVEGPHADDAFLIEGMADQALRFGFPEGRSFVPDRWLVQGDKVSLGALTLEVLHCPGHTPGHVVFFEPTARVAQVGDVLFRGSIGRTDFPRGDHATLLASIHDRLLPLGDDVTIIPGHGPLSTLGEERRTNPYLEHGA
ncbi:MBL fold metallo-hydrolase [Rhodospirillum rubrum]|uniref:Beta-lactamase-like n=2 Tax=Rhodospirillum rubrum TaxID=1085 RepID=Q2RU73_RHORT|nr:MBL fold metallo-hydrolase [Rhodospirillum rubrum]ABC22322.1 Beta-lactamase-like [Rhodospirillum rubrum ATCC 11170]MBK5953902.1 MBL fold metallo-hydrolase [Rhodospirillum rubrum]